MASNDYHFITHWHVRATREEIAEILADAEDLARWWPSVYLAVRVLEPGDENGVGRYVDLYTRGWLPYTLRWRFRVTKSNPPKGFEIEAEGDFVGRGTWTFAPDDEYTHVIYDWKIRADKPLLRYFSFIMKPIFSANHHWAMAQGEKSLELELARRRAASSAERELIPAPPPPSAISPSSAVPLLALSAGSVALAILLARRRSSR
jgi:hypothetical protein